MGGVCGTWCKHDAIPLLLVCRFSDSVETYAQYSTTTEEGHFRNLPVFTLKEVVETSM